MTAPRLNLVEVDLGDLIVPSEFQRSLVPWPKNTEFSWEKYEPNPIVVGLYPGEEGRPHYALIRGQRRADLARRSGIKRLPAILLDRSVEAQARVFVDEVETSKRIRPLEKFKAKLFYGDPENVSADKITRFHNFVIMPGGGPRVIEAVDTVLTLNRTKDPSHHKRDFALGLWIADLWLDQYPKDVHVHTGDMLRALTRFAREFEKSSAFDTYAVRIAQKDPEAIYFKAQQHGGFKAGFRGGGGLAEPLFQVLKSTAKARARKS